MIDCKICHQKFKTLTGSHLATHDIGVNEYKKKFRVKYIHSREARRKISWANIGNIKTRGKKMNLSLDIRAKRSRFLTSLNQLKTIQRKRKIQMAGNKLHKGVHHTKAFKLKTSKRFKALWAKPTWRKKMLQTRKGTPSRQ